MTKPTEPSQYGRVRASDAEREQYAQILRAAMSEGRLSMEIGEERLGHAYAATYRDELDPLIADLPRGAAFRTPEFLEEAQRRLRRHRSVVISVAALLTGIWLLFAILVHPVFFWPIIPIAIMALGLRRHRRVLRWYARGGWGPWTRGWGGPGWGGPAAGPGVGGPGRDGPGWGGPGRGWEHRGWEHRGWGATGHGHGSGRGWGQGPGQAA
jgi:hypothetical protein